MFKNGKKILTIFILFMCLVMSFCLVSFAEDNLISDNLSNWTVSSDSTASPTFFYNEGENRLQFNNPSASFITYYTLPTIQSYHTYVLTFTLRGLYARCNFGAYITKSGSSDVYSFTSVTSSLNSNTTYTFSFSSSDLLDYFDDLNSLQLNFNFVVRGTYNSFSVYVSDISLIDDTSSGGSGSVSIPVAIQDVFIGYINPSLNFIANHINTFFTYIESHWFCIFVWYVMNSAFIVWVVINSILNWGEIASEGTFALGLNLLRKNKLDRYYEEKRQQVRADSEERYRIRQAERQVEADKRAEKREIERVERAKVREKQKLASIHFIGNSGKYSDKELAEAYFKQFPNRYSITIGNHTYKNFALLEKAKRDSERKSNKDVSYDIDKAQRKARSGPIDISKREE